jgi:hypothetical protein
MRKISISTIGLALFLLFVITDNVNAQSNGNKGQKNKPQKEVGPPPWAPAHGYRAKTRYTYFSQQNFYYDNQRGVYIYLSGKNWQVSANIPDAFKGVNLTAAVKVDLDFNGDDPQKYNADHKAKYKKGSK